MLREPPAALIVAEVRGAIEQGLAPGFAQKVAANALGIAERELAQEAALAAEERAGLAPFVGPREDLREGNARLCAAIREGVIDASDPRLVGHLIRTAVAALSVDQPGYPAFAAWRAGPRGNSLASADSRRQPDANVK